MIVINKNICQRKGDSKSDITLPGDDVVLPCKLENGNLLCYDLQFRELSCINCLI